MRARLSITRSLGLAVGWILASAVLGPLAYGIGVTSWLAARGNPFWRSDLLAFPLTALGIASIAIPSLLVGVPLFTPFLLLWAVMARRWRPLERVGGLLVGTLILAALGGLLLYRVRDRDPRPLAPHGLPVLLDALKWSGMIWLALLLPRAVVPALRLGAFAPTEQPVPRR